MPRKPTTISEAVLREADALLADEAVEDAARDFVESGIGRFNFARNWAQHRDPDHVAAWLRRYGYEADPAAVLTELDRLAADGPWRRS